MTELRNASVIGRLLEEISWEGSNVRAYRDGGRGRENVLTAEVLWPLSMLPRSAFLGEVIKAAHGADRARGVVVADSEGAVVELLPDEYHVGQREIVVQPDATIASDQSFVLVEAKRIKSSSFQPDQLAREFVALQHEAGNRVPLLLLILGTPPPVTVKSRGKLDVAEAIAGSIGNVLDQPVTDAFPDLNQRIGDQVAWITWTEVATVVEQQAARFASAPHGLNGTVQRLCAAAISAIAWHG